MEYFLSSVLDDLWKTLSCVSRRVRGWKLAKSQLSQLVLKCRSFDLFQWNFGNLRQFFFVRRFDRSVSFPNCNRKWRTSKKKCSWQELNFISFLTSFNSSPVGVSVSSFWIQKSSRRFNLNFKISLSIMWILLSCSINLNFCMQIEWIPRFSKMQIGRDRF